jgi:sn-glycerol 3-phosphate transport system permease protein
MSRKTKQSLYYNLGGLLKLALGILLIFPIIYAAGLSFMDAAEITTPPPKVLPRSFGYLENYITIFTKTKMLRFLLNSLLVSVFGTMGRLITAVTASFAFCFYEFKGKNFLFYLILGSMMIPGDAIILTNYLTVSRMGIMNTFLGLVIIYLVHANYIFMMRQSMLSLPKSLHEAALIDGCSSLRFLISIVIPLSKPIITTISLSSFVGLWNIYLWPLLITNAEEMRTVQVGITMLNTAEQQSYGPIMAASCVALLPAVVIFLISQRGRCGKRGITRWRKFFRSGRGYHRDFPLASHGRGQR